MFSENSLHANTSSLGISQHDRILPLFVLPIFFAVSAVFLKARGVKASGGPATEDRLNLTAEKRKFARKVMGK